jgi:hypothetical protein
VSLLKIITNRIVKNVFMLFITWVNHFFLNKGSCVISPINIQ